ncbi:MAG: O-antigen ligase family protein [Planctomycetaceae bacterium]|nr:O-antigen ligase family protein [Planctomycetaceae bacterium]
MKGLLFTFGLCYGGAIVSLFRPYYGLLIYICFAIIKPEALWHWSVPQGNYSRIIAIALIVGWGIHGFGGFQFGKSKWIIAALSAYFLWGVLSATVSPNPGLGFQYVEGQFKIVLPVIIGATLIKNRRQLMQLAWTITISMGYLAYDLNQAYFQGNNILQRQGFAGMDNNSFAIGLVAVVGLAFFLGLGSKKLPAKLLAFAIAALITHAVIFSFSRGAMLSLCVVGIVTFWYIPKRPAYLMLFVVGLTTAYSMAGNEVMERFASAFVDEGERDEAASNRVVLWTACLGMIQDSPLVGVGPDRFTKEVFNYAGNNEGSEAHTLWLTIGAELGIPGLLFLLSFYLGTCALLTIHLWTHGKTKDQDPFDRLVPQMVITSLAGFMVAAQFVSLEGLEVPFYVTLLGAGALKVYAIGNSSGRRPRRRIIMVPTSTPQPPEPLHV